MQNPRPDSILESHRKLAVENLKRCPLCSTVNARLNEECFVCRWHGGFDHDPDSVQEGLADLLDRCPELLDSVVLLPRSNGSLLERMRGWLRGLRRPHLDIEA